MTIRPVIAFAAAAACAIVARTGARAAAPSGTVDFTAHEITTGLRGGYQVVVADMNKDGKPDIIALASGLPELAWYENPTWTRHVIVGGVSRLINVAAADLDGDGIPELALAQGFTMSPKTSTGEIAILTHDGDPTGPWKMKEIDKVPTAHRLRWVDAEGNGRRLLVMAPLIGPDAVEPDYKSPMSVFFYRPPDFKREVVTDRFTGLVHGVEPVSWPGVKGQAALTAGFMGVYVHRFANGAWSSTRVVEGDPQPWPKSGTSDAAVGRLGSQRFIAAIEPWHGNEVVIYREDRNGWRRQPIDDGIEDGHTLVTLDVDGDGRDEVLVGQRGGARTPVLYTASPDGSTWSRRVVDDHGMAAAGCAAADLNGDGRVDFVCIGTATANLKWYENTGRR